jgi:hypothetical protein
MVFRLLSRQALLSFYTSTGFEKSTGRVEVTYSGGPEKLAVAS